MAFAIRAFAGSLLLAWQLASAVSPKELAQWFTSPAGLGMSPQAAQALADQTWNGLTQAQVAVPKLQELKDTLAGKQISMTMEDIRANILLLAEHHIVPGNLTDMYTALYRSYTLSGGLGLAKADAVKWTIILATYKVEVSILYALYKVMYGYSGLGMDQYTAQNVSIVSAASMADAATFKDQYKKAISSGATSATAQNVALRESVNSYLAGLTRRYAKDAKPYSSMDFQQHFGPNGWVQEWLAAPIELRVGADLKEHTAGWFQGRYGSEWQGHYMSAQEAIQERVADDGKAYTMKDFQQYYGDNWQAKWFGDAEIPCTICGPFAHQTGVAAAEEIMV